MKRIYTHLLVWMVIVSVFATRPMDCISALTVSPETLLSNGHTHLRTAPRSEPQAHAGTSEFHSDHLLYFQVESEEESRENLQHFKQFAIFVDSLPGIQSVAARQLLLSVNHFHLAGSNLSRPLRL